ncbi:glycosyl hydrolase [Algibacter luteus]|uniref:Glycosyl hydrolases family 2, sugar binding domain n=1 Tax=Algibacter luteus TaxID=1178825 RepID=A0A1M6A4V4_9FLAO|nr:glycosyl hydrolase [Algibacter luteus]SHI31532.1 Glycosyl hydrolases family 2, sugar binding domain [Algibacter luteus]
MIRNRVLNIKIRNIVSKAIFVALLLSLSVPTFQAQNASLEESFKNPPPNAKPQTIWFWINGNVTKTGITADLEAMKNVGIQGAILFNVSLGNPEGVAPYLSPEWLELFNYAGLEAQRLGLDLGFHNGAGWSSSGGPSITPEYAMQELVYTETLHQGATVFKGKLEQPETKLGFYKDIAILAFPKPKSNVRIDELEIKILSHKVRSHLNPDDKPITDLAVVKKQDIIDLTSKLNSDGFLEWNVPEGDWIILRIGHTPTGEMNRFPSDGGRGLECDKMNKQAVDVFWDGSIKPILKKLDTLVGTTVKRCHIDSYEVGTTNWTSNFAEAFKKLRFYDCRSYLPALAGYYVESGEETERFLWDFRRTIGDLIAENYYGRFAELSHKNNMFLSIEPYWGPFDNMQIGEKADMVMSEFWSGSLAFFDSPKFVASIAKLNGNPIAEAESFTGMGGWDQHPSTLKAMGDLAWAQGINRFVFHSYVHQPWDVGPGLTLQVFGTDFNRLNTWWDQSKPFVDYISRGQFLLQQGTSVADVLVFTGEASPNDALLMPEIKALGYDYDVIGSNKIKALTVKDGLVCTSVGEKYRALVLPSTDWVTPEILNKIEELTENGALVVGSKPNKSPSLKKYPECDEDIEHKANKLWDKGLVKAHSIADVLKNGALPPDFSIEKGHRESIDFIHRKTEDADIYFVVNSKKESRELACRFRVIGKQPELWNAETGKITKATIWHKNDDGTTTVSISFEPEGSVFVVFRNPIRSSQHIVNAEIKLKNPVITPLSNLKIIKAEYGTFLPDGLVDATEVIANRIQNNRLNIHATRELSKGDPAPGYKKELRIQYKIGEAVFEKNAMEKEWLEIDAPINGKLEILNAVFGKFARGVDGIPPNKPVFDVTKKVKSMVTSGVYEIPVNDSFLEEKEIKTKKALRVIYTTNDEEKIVTVSNGGILKLTQTTSEPKLVFEGDKVNLVTPFAGEMTYESSNGKTKTLKVNSVPEPIELTGNWNVSFPLKDKAVLDKTFKNLTSWSDASEEDIRYFSGTASYRKEFQIPAKLIKSCYSLELDLSNVKVIAEVILNGKNLGILWKSPFRINIDEAVVKGTNTLEVKITNLWPNRLIGDEQLPLDYKRKGPQITQWPEWLLNNEERPTERETLPAFKHWHKDSKLLPSGLLGPVKIVIYKSKEIN